MIIVYLLMAGCVVALDQLVKFWTVANIDLGGVLPVWDGVIHLTYLKNTGAAFSMLSKHTWLLTVISCVCIVIIFVMLCMKKVPAIQKIPLTLIMGGAIGNVIDRINLGYVVDMFEVEFIEFAVFNVADAFITCAGIFFCIVYIIEIIREEREKKEMKNRRMPELERLKKNMTEEADEPAAKKDDGGDTVDESHTG